MMMNRRILKYIDGDMNGTEDVNVSRMGENRNRLIKKDEKILKSFDVGIFKQDNDTFFYFLRLFLNTLVRSKLLFFA